MGYTKQSPSGAEIYGSMPIPVIPTGGTGILHACPRHTVALLTMPEDLIAGFRMRHPEGLAAGCPWIFWAALTWTRLHQSGGSSGCPQCTSAMRVHLKRCRAPRSFNLGVPRAFCSAGVCRRDIPRALITLQMSSTCHNHNP